MGREGMGKGIGRVSGWEGRGKKGNGREERRRERERKEEKECACVYIFKQAGGQIQEERHTVTSGK